MTENDECLILHLEEVQKEVADEKEFELKINERKNGKPRHKLDPLGSAVFYCLMSLPRKSWWGDDEADDRFFVSEEDDKKIRLKSFDTFNRAYKIVVGEYCDVGRNLIPLTASHSQLLQIFDTAIKLIQNQSFL
jgi:hypothetical protein